MRNSVCVIYVHGNHIRNYSEPWIAMLSFASSFAQIRLQLRFSEYSFTCNTPLLYPQSILYHERLLHSNEIIFTLKI